MDLSLKLRQTQKLSPQMLLSMDILQMGTLELREYLGKAALENPVIELEEEQPAKEPSELARRLEWLDRNDRQNHFYHREDAESIAEVTAPAQDRGLYQHLRDQLPLERFSPSLQGAVECVLTSLNDNGYLEESTDELAARCKQSLAAVKKAEEIVRKLEPPGIAARSLSECLIIQLKRMGETGLALRIVQDFLEDMAHEHYNHIAAETGAGRKEIQDACRMIRSLNPKPGTPFAQHDTSDFTVTGDQPILPQATAGLRRHGSAELSDGKTAAGRLDRTGN